MSVGAAKRMLTGVKVVSGSMEMSHGASWQVLDPPFSKNKDFCVCKTEKGMQRAEEDIY